MKNSIIPLIIILLILIILFGILNGWFRTKESLSQEELYEIGKIQSNSTVIIPPLNPTKEMFSKLWFDHVKRTREFIIASLDNDPNIKDKETILLQNQEDIGNEIDKYYPGSATLITNLLKEHIVIAKDIVEDLKYKRIGRLPSDINKWYVNSDQFSNAMVMINPDWNIKSHMQEHLLLTEQEAIAEWLGLEKSSLNIYNNKIVPQAQELANHISDNIPSHLIKA